MPFTSEWMPMPKAESPMASSMASLSFSLIPRLRRSPARLPMRMKRALTVVGSIDLNPENLSEWPAVECRDAPAMSLFVNNLYPGPVSVVFPGELIDVTV